MPLLKGTVIKAVMGSPEQGNLIVMLTIAAEDRNVNVQYALPRLKKG